MQSCPLRADAQNLLPEGMAAEAAVADDPEGSAGDRVEERDDLGRQVLPILARSHAGGYAAPAYTLSASVACCRRNLMSRSIVVT